MTYCIEVWGCASQTQFNFFLLQKKIIRIMRTVRYRRTNQSIFPFNGSSSFKENIFSQSWVDYV